jgi:predicted phage tail protein
MSYNGLAPAAPTLTGPAVLSSDVTPTLTWSASAGATHYDLCINDLTTGQWQVIRSLTTNDFTTTSLHAGSYVAWVRAFDSANQTRGWSAGCYFTITPPAAPTLLSPAGPTTSVTPTFSWSAVTDAASYDLCVENLSTGRFQIISNLSANVYSSLTLPSKGTYRFWVRAFNESGDIGGWSTKVHFTII